MRRWRWRMLLAVLLGCAGVAALTQADTRPVALGMIHAYQRHLAPIAARVGGPCRFSPSCSRYAETVIARDGVLVGGVEAVRRLVRCGPWTPAGTVDEP